MLRACSRCAGGPRRRTPGEKGRGVGRGKWADALPRVGLPLVFAGAIVGFGVVMNRHYPIADWLFVRYAAYWLSALLFVAACFSSGHLVVTRVLGGRVLPLFEQLAVSFAAGVYVFFLGMMLGGLLRLYGGIFFFALPLLLFAAGARPFVRYLRRVVRHLRGAYRRSPRSSPWGVLVHAFGLLGLLMVYVAVLSPNNTAFDARWQHLGLAEHYAAVGGVTRFPEGWFIGAAPHLASFLYTWAFLLPKSRIFDHIELAAHVEYVVFAFGLIGIPAMVRRLVRPRAVGAGAYRYAWAARFLFPGIFLYDSSLCLGADHIASVFAVPIYVLLLRAWKDLAPRACVLLALALSGALLTKYTGALLMVAPALVAVPVRAVVLGIRTLRRRGEPLARDAWYAGPLAALAAGLIFTAPHWIKNLVWYGDPLYPVLHARFAPRPWTPDTAVRFDVGFMAQLWRPERSLKGLGQTVRALFTFSFVPNDWEKFHGTTPVFGSLFTLSLLAMPFLKGTRRLWALYGATHLGIFVWYWTHHQDRYLQAALPWMTAATVAVLALVWRQGLAARLAAGALVALQIVWGADVFFMPGHVFLGVPARAAIDLISRGPGKIEKDRFVYTDAFVGVGRSLPPASKVLIHEFHPHLGVNAPSVTDCPFHQGGISYLRTPTPRQVYDQLSGYGVTHLVYKTSQAREPDVLGGEIVFANFLQRYAGAPKSVEGWQVAAMPKEAPPPGGAPDPVLVFTCGKGLVPGLYHLADLKVPAIEKGKPAPKPFKPAAGDAAALVAEAQAVAQDHGCPSLPAGVEGAFVRVATRDPFAIWVRR
jgi:hypothetical protein